MFNWLIYLIKLSFNLTMTSLNFGTETMKQWKKPETNEICVCVQSEWTLTRDTKRESEFALSRK